MLFPITMLFSSDLAFGDDLPIVMTAKDAVKCASFPLTNGWQVPVVATLSAEFYEHLIEN